MFIRWQMYDIATMSALALSADLESNCVCMQCLARPQAKSQCVLTLNGLSMVVHASANHITIHHSIMLHAIASAASRKPQYVSNWLQAMSHGF